MKQKIDILLESPFFQGMSEEDLLLIVPLLQERRYKKNNIIFFEGQEGSELYFIASGCVRIYRAGESKEITLNHLREGEMFGEAALLQRQGRVRSASVSATEDTVLLVLPGQAFVDLLTRRAELAIKLLDITMERLRAANGLIQNLTMLDVRSRIIRVVLDLEARYGQSHPQGRLIEFKLTHHQIAEMAGTNRETVTKALNELQSEGMLIVEGKKLIVHDPRRLQLLITSS